MIARMELARDKTTIPKVGSVITLRIPREVHKALIRLAHKKETSLNRLCYVTVNNLVAEAIEEGIIDGAVQETQTQNS